MIVVGKPVTQKDASNTGWIDPSDFGVWAKQAHADLGWNTGMFTWQYPSDNNGTYVSTFLNSYA